MATTTITFSPDLLAAMCHRARAWKDKYKGERCFCIGNGPSLAKTPLHLLCNEYTFGMNKIAKIFPSTPWRPTFYVNTGGGPKDVSCARVAREAMKCAISFVEYSNLNRLLEREGDKLRLPSNVIPVRVSHKGGIYDDPDPSLWSHDITERVSKDGSTMLSAMQIAVYMGFTTIYLVGCDLGWKPFDWEEDKDPNHFCEDYWDKMKMGSRKVIVTQEYADNSERSIRSAHVLAKKVCDSLGVKIYNATVGGELEVHPRVDIYDILREGELPY